MFEATIAVWKVAAMGLQLESATHTCLPNFTSQSETNKMKCAADLGSMIASWSAIVAYTASPFNTCPVEGNIPAVCAASIAKVFDALGRFTSGPLVVYLNCGKPRPKAFLPWPVDRRWTGLGSCVVNSGQATEYLMKSGLTIRAASVSDCPQANSTKYYLKCVADISSILSAFAVSTSYLSTAAAVCGEYVNQEDACASGVTSVIAGVAELTETVAAIALTCPRYSTLAPGNAPNR